MNKLIQYAVMVAVGVLVFSALLVPIVNDAQYSTATATLNTTENFNAVYTENLETDIAVGLDADNKLVVNGAIITPALDLTETVIVTNQFVITYDGAALNFLGLSGGSLTNITIHPGGTYDGVKTDNNTFTGTGVNVVIYPDNNGKYGAFVQGNGNESFWLDNGKTAYISFLSGGVTDNNGNNHYVNCLYSATNENYETVWNTVYSLEDPDGAWVDLPSTLKLNQPYTKEVGDFAVKWDTNNYTATFTNESGDFDKVVGSPIVYAPLEYHYLAEKDGALYSMIGVIPLIVIVGLIAGIIGVIAVRRGN